MASLHSLGTVPRCKVWVNSAVRAGASSHASSLRTRPAIPSGPEDLLGLSLDSSFCTPGLWISRGGIVPLTNLLGPNQGMEEVSSLLNTDLNSPSKMAAFDFASVYKLPRCLRGGIPTDSWRWAFINFQKGFVSPSPILPHIWSRTKDDLALLMSLAVCLWNLLYSAILPGLPFRLARLYIRCLRRVLRLSSGVSQGRCCHLEAVLLGTWALTEDKMWSLNLTQFSSTENWSKWVMNEAAKVLAASLILPQLALENIYTVRGAFLWYAGVMLLSQTTARWSEIPGVVVTHLTSEGLLEQIRSRTRSSLEGSFWSWVKWWSWRVSIKVSHACLLTLPGGTDSSCQSMSPRLKSPATLIFTESEFLARDLMWLTDLSNSRIWSRGWALDASVS